MAWDDEQLRAWGRMSVQFGSLEILVGYILMGFVSDDQTASQIVVADASMAWMIEKLRGFADIVVEDDEARDALKAWVGSVDGIRKERNRWAHTAGMEDEGGGVTIAISFSIRGKRSSTDPTVVTQPVDANDIERFADKIKAVSARGISELAPLLASRQKAHWHGDYRDE